MNDDVPLVLGGHTFIEELGTDPPLSPAEQREVVARCLDEGVTWFDTTYLPERVALGRALADLGRRDEATIVAWNFFGPAHSAPTPYRRGHLDAVCGELGVEYVDRLVVHPPYDPDPPAHQRGLATAMAWREEGRVGQLGTWQPGPDADETYGTDNPYDFMVTPHNVATDAEDAFAAGRRLGWETVAVSPFVRGWTLEDMVTAAADLGEASEDRVDGSAGADGVGGADAGGENAAVDESALRSRLADHMLRYSLYGADVDRLVVAMRRPEWVTANVASAERGPLADDERAWLERVHARAEASADDPDGE